ncbi:hypothetical protein [Pseudooceanicola sp. LIPI14-2-Ac024]|uniref:hypothetical protein n=1 Tax=Pseudooceanicola sp. LIPI14-2-Ac024 TaxID=3344875 RepID=UPI0035CF399A
MTSLLCSIAEGKIRARQFLPEDVLGSALFDEVEIRAALIEGGANVALSARDISRMTGWKADCVSHWCASGLIRAGRGRIGAIDAWLIEPAALAEFQASYFVLSDVAARNGTSSRALIRKLAAYDIDTVGAMSVGKTSRGHLLPVSALGKLIFSASPGST